jgi:hypothetical protein
MQAMANYFPENLDDNLYDKYSVSLPQFKADIEERYPQVCANCAPLVNNRIQSMTYLARAENLKLNLGRKRNGWAHKSFSTWKRDLFIILAGFLWIFSTTSQFLWHLLGANLYFRLLHKSNLIPDVLVDYFNIEAWDMHIYTGATAYIPIIIGIAVFSSWWNPQLLNASRNTGKLLRMKDYYMIQLIFFAFRVLGYWGITQSSHALPVPLHAWHGFMAVFILICAVSSLRIVEFWKKPVLSDYHLKLVPIPEPFMENPKASDLLNKPNASKPAFPIASLASPSMAATSIAPSRRSSITSIATSRWPNDDSSEMDWTPTAQTNIWTPRKPTRSAITVSTTTTSNFSPFRTSMAANHSTLKNLRPLPKHEPDTPVSAKKKDRLEMDIAPPKLNIQKDTGLESLFDNSFSLNEEHDWIKEVRAQRVTQPSGSAGMPFWTIFLAMVGALGVAITLVWNNPVLVVDDEQNILL